MTSSRRSHPSLAFPSAPDFIRVVNRAILASGRRAYVYVVISSIGTLLISVLVNSVTDYDPGTGPNFELLAAFLIVCAMTTVARGETTRIMNAVGEGIAHHMRMQFSLLLRNADLEAVEQIGRDTIRSTLARNAQVLAESPPVIAQGIASGVTLVLATIYVGTLSLAAAVLIVALTAIVMWASRMKTERTRAVMAEGQRAEKDFFDSFGHLLDGLKEARMDQHRTEDLVENFLRERADEARSTRLIAMDSMIAFGLLVVVSFYLLLGTVTFITPQYVDSAATAMKIVYISSVIWLLIEGLLRLMPTIIRGDAAFSELRKMEQRLKACQRYERSPGLMLPEFLELSVENLFYAYPSSPEEFGTFSIGPCSLTLKPGEIVFILGGNGSGKTTLLRSICLLYQPTGGRVLWNGIEINSENVTTYRSRISAIFADFHLFDHLYGARDTPDHLVNEALAAVGLGAKLSYKNGRFSTLKLSTGQRKRLALALALVEDRDICLFDEIAAEQDPAFRRRIYEDFLPKLRQKNKAVLVITHDERFFALADRIYHMDEGQLRLKEE